MPSNRTTLDRTIQPIKIKNNQIVKNNTKSSTNENKSTLLTTFTLPQSPSAENINDESTFYGLVKKNPSIIFLSVEIDI